MHNNHPLVLKENYLFMFLYALVIGIFFITTKVFALDIIRKISGILLLFYFPTRIIKLFKINDKLENFLFTLSLSPLIFTLFFFIFTHFFGFDILINFYITTFVLFFLTFFTVSHKDKNVLCCFKKRYAGYFCIFFVCLVILLILLVAPLINSTEAQLSYHGLFHSSIIYQIIKGNIPPHNPALYKYPINTYWAYHLWLGILMNVLNISPPQASVLNNFITMLTLIGIIYLTSRILYPYNRLANLLAPFYIFSAVNILGFLVFLSNFIFKFRDWKLLEKFQPTYEFFLSPLDKAWLVSLFPKFLNFTGFSLGILYISAMIFLVSKILKSKIYKYCYFFFYLFLLGAFLFHPTSAIISLTAIFLGVLLMFKSQDISCKIILSVILSGISSLFYLYPIWDALKSYRIGLGITPVFLKDVIWAYFLVIFFIIKHFFYKKKEIIYLFLPILFILLIAESIFLKFYDINQEKIGLAASIPAGIILSFELVNLRKKIKNIFVKKIYMFFFVFSTIN